MKANPFLVHAMKELAAKFEVCSPGEFSICEREQVDMNTIVLSGVNKEKSDIEHVMDNCGGVGIYTVESIRQFQLLADCATKRKKRISVLLRVTSGNQFGLDESEVETIVAQRMDYEYIEIRGIQCYTGTQKKKIEHIEKEIDWLDQLCDNLKDKYGFCAIEFEYGPGLPISYFGEEAYHHDYDMLKQFAVKLNSIRNKYEITLEMGRYMVATCGIYVSSVADIKTNQGQNYCIIDGGINHINYYGQTMAMKIPAYSFVKADGLCPVAGVDMSTGQSLAGDELDLEKWTICGSLCTVGDVVVKNLPVGKPQVGDFLVFYNIGAYSVTEGIYLFLSRKMPRIIAYSSKSGIEIYRDIKYSDIINSREQSLCQR
jgi:diaminopimelate decarboxylase